MPLYISRFFQFPQFLKPITVIVTILLIAALATGSTAVAGTSLIWFNIVLSLIYVVSLTVLLALELEGSVFPIARITYAAFEVFGSLLFAIFYFISIWLCINGKEFASDWAYVFGAFLSFAIFALYMINFIAFLRIWMREQREARRDSSAAYDFPNYGSPY